jgi:precorrin-2 dehydrogenase/sirohydrochlorin ferrochelatase
MATTTPHSVPVALHLTDRRCVVVGGGHVGVRRALQLRAGGGQVTLVSPEIWPERAADELRRDGIEWLRRGYADGDLDGAFLVVAATGRSDVDRRVLDAAARGGVLVNNVSDADAGDLSFVATRDIGQIQVSVSTGGRTPALTRYLRDRLADEVADGYPALVEMFGDAREELRAAGRPTTHPGWDAALDDGILDLVRSGDAAAAEALLRRHLELAPRPGG